MNINTFFCTFPRFAVFTFGPDFCTFFTPRAFFKKPPICRLLLVGSCTVVNLTSALLENKEIDCYTHCTFATAQHEPYADEEPTSTDKLYEGRMDPVV